MYLTESADERMALQRETYSCVNVIRLEALKPEQRAVGGMTYHAHNMDTPKMKKTQYTGLEKGELD
jgi:hypothetical protein